MPTPTITDIDAREILDCRLEPTLEVTVHTTQDSGCAAVPAGRSRGTYEAVDLRDQDERYAGRGVQTAVNNVTDHIAPELTDRPVTNQRAIDTLLRDLDGTPNSSNLGGNALTGVSLATLKAGAASRDQPLYQYLGGISATQLPVPVLDLIEGGELAGNPLTFQEHQIIPTQPDSFTDTIRKGAEIYSTLGDTLAADWGADALNVGFEGGYTPSMTDPRDAFDALLTAIDDAGYADEFALGIDAAATHLYDSDTDTYTIQDETFTPDELLEFYQELAADYPLISIEDPFHDDDFARTADLTNSLDIQIIGDDLFVSHSDRVQRGIKQDAANALLLKVNQVGTVSEAADAAEMATQNGYAVQVSERSGQTADTWLADLAVGLSAGQIKTGVTRSERTAQYNRLLAIEADLGTSASIGVPGLAPN